MKLCFAIFLLVSHVLLADAYFLFNTTALTLEQEKNIVNVIKVTVVENWANERDYLLNLTTVLSEGIEEVAKNLTTKPVLVTMFVRKMQTTGFDFSEPLKFVVLLEQGIVDGEELKLKADVIKSAVKEKAEEYPDLEFTIAVVDSGLAKRVIVLTVIAVMLLIAVFLMLGATGFLNNTCTRDSIRGHLSWIGSKWNRNVKQQN